jgi:hypothetical protein
MTKWPQNMTKWPHNMTKWPQNMTKWPQNRRNVRNIYHHLSLQDTLQFTQIGVFGLKI